MPVSRLPLAIEDLRAEIIKECGAEHDPDITIALDSPTFRSVVSALRSHNSSYQVVLHPGMRTEHRYQGVSIIERMADVS